MILAKKPQLGSLASYIQEASTYVPGKPVEELEREFGVFDVVKLASNENPLGPSPKAQEAMATVGKSICLYPDANHYYLRQQLAEKNNLSIDEVIIGNGSNEIMDFLIRAFCVPGDNILSCNAAFIAYRICTKIHGVEYREPDSSTPKEELSQMLKMMDARTRLIFLPNPNNPTGTYINRDLLVKYMENLKNKNVIVVLDYAYWEYVRTDDFMDPMEIYRTFPNIIILRTFSKIYGLAALRIGYGFAHPDILAPLHKIKMPFNVNSLALKAAEAALGDTEHLRLSYEVNEEGMDYLTQELDRLGLSHRPSQANFILVDYKKSVQDLYPKLLQEGVIIRPMDPYGFPTQMRVSIGKKEHNKKFITSLEKFL